MKVVILGGCGFLGLHIAEKLVANNIKTVLVDSKTRLHKPIDFHKYQLVEIDYPYRDIEVLESVLKKNDVFIHLGWSQVPNDNLYGFKKDISQNILISAELFHLARNLGVGRIIFASSGGSVYGDLAESPINEKCATNPISSYGVAKLATEKYLTLLTANSPTDHIIFRIGNAYGNHLLPCSTATGLIPSVIKALISDNEIEIWGNGQVIRDFINVKDIANAFYLATVMPKINGIFNIGTGKGTSIKNLISMIENKLNKSAKIIWSDNRMCDVKEAVLDYGKFKTLSQWTPQISLEKGVSEMVSTYKG